MSKYIGAFEKVSFEQFRTDIAKLYYTHYSDYYLGRYNEKDLYDNIKLPTRATIGSAGYDFFSQFPDDITLLHEQSIIIPTGIKCRIDDGWWLGLFPKSGLGNNYRVRLDDTIAVIDSDYYNCAANEGHILVKITNHDGEHRCVKLKKGKSYCQGIFLPYGLADGDNVTEIRTGGFGSTGR